MKDNNYLYHIILGTICLLTLASTIANPMKAMLASHINEVSLFEFYLIYVLMKNTTPSSSKPTKNGFLNHLLSDFQTSGKYIFYGLTCLAVLGWLVLPFMGISTIFIPHAFSFSTVLPVLKFYAIAQCVTAIISLWSKRQSYKLVGLAPIFLSLAFAILTDLAASYIAVSTALAGVVYFTSMIPLMFFLGTAAERNPCNELSTVKQSTSPSERINSICYIIGASSLIIHIIEASCFVASLYSPVFRPVADFIRCNQIQGPLLTATTLAAGAKAVNEATPLQTPSI